MSGLKLSIIIVNYNSPELISKCLESIDNYVTELSREVIIVDNNSQEENLDELRKKYDFVRVIRLPENFGFGRGNNIGVTNAQGKILLLLNSDTELIDNSVNKALSDFYEKNARELWGLKILWPSKEFQNSFTRDLTFLDFILFYTPLSNLIGATRRSYYHKYENKPIDEFTQVPVVYGTAMLMWRQDFLSLNGFAEKYFMYFEDIDFCERFRKDLHGAVCYYPYSSLIHHVQGSLSGNKLGINYRFYKSKYIYGLSKFKAVKMLLFFLVDVASFMVVRAFRVLKMLKPRNNILSNDR